MRRSRYAAIPLLLVAALGLTGCSAVDGFPIFDRPAVESDSIPDDFGDDPVRDLDLDTARLAGEFQTSTLYLVRSKSGDTCLAIYPEGFTFCSPDGMMSVTAAEVGTFEIGPASQFSKDGWTRVSENILAIPNF